MAIKPIGTNEQIYEVELTFTSDNDEVLRVLTEQIRDKNFPNTGRWTRLDLILSELEQYDTAERICRVSLHPQTESSGSSIYLS